MIVESDGLLGLLTAFYLDQKRVNVVVLNRAIDVSQS